MQSTSTTSPARSNGSPMGGGCDTPVLRRYDSRGSSNWVGMGRQPSSGSTGGYDSGHAGKCTGAIIKQARSVMSDDLMIFSPSCQGHFKARRAATTLPTKTQRPIITTAPRLPQDLAGNQPLLKSLMEYASSSRMSPTSCPSFIERPSIHIKLLHIWSSPCSAWASNMVPIQKQQRVHKMVKGEPTEDEVKKTMREKRVQARSSHKNAIDRQNDSWLAALTEKQLLRRTKSVYLLYRPICCYSSMPSCIAVDPNLLRDWLCSPRSYSYADQED